MTLKTLAAAACLSICTATAGLAATVTVTVDSIRYEVSDIYGTFNEHQALLHDQVWYGDPTVARDFALAVGTSLLFGSNNFELLPIGPLFFSHYAADASWVVQTVAFTTVYFGPRTVAPVVERDTPYIYAIATPLPPVPLPAGGLLLVSAFGGIAALKRRKKGTA